MRTPLGSRLLRGGLAALGIGLTAFHLLLLAGRVADGSVLDPAVAGEWIIGLLLLLGLLQLHRRRASAFCGRSALVLWVLVLLLHALTLAPSDAGGFELRIDALVVSTAPLWTAVGVALSCVLGLFLARAKVPSFPILLGACALSSEARRLLSRLLSTAGPRAPPVWLPVTIGSTD